MAGVIQFFEKKIIAVFCLIFKDWGNNFGFSQSIKTQLMKT